jgi:hypothetical protein
MEYHGCDNVVIKYNWLTMSGATQCPEPRNMTPEMFRQEQLLHSELEIQDFAQAELFRYGLFIFVAVLCVIVVRVENDKTTRNI